MTEAVVLFLETTIDGETVEITLCPNGRIEIGIKIYDPKNDSFISRIADIANPRDVNDLGARLVVHSLRAARDMDRAARDMDRVADIANSTEGKIIKEEAK